MDFDRSTTPASCSAEAPSTATAMARSRMRMREGSPMFTQSGTAAMVQKWVLLPTAPKMKARTKAPPVTYGTSCAGFGSMVSAPLGSLALRRVQALPGARRGAALRVFGDHVFEGLLRALAVAHGFLRARDAEQRVGRLLAVGPGGEQLSLRGDCLLVVALPGVGHADPVLR